MQSLVESALSRVADSPVEIITAGRTDAKVHATHQVIHFDSDTQRSNFSWCRGTNRFLDQDVRLLWVQTVDEEFHARFSALTRSYRYIIYNNPIKSAIYRNYVTHEYRKLNFSEMAIAGNKLLGEHDFSSFRAASCQAHSPVRTIKEFSLKQQGEWIWFDVKANAFLQHMVRNIAGALIEVGVGEQSVNWIEELLNIKDRTKAGITAQPNGLYLVGVEYDDEYKLQSNLKPIAYWGHKAD